MAEEKNPKPTKVKNQEPVDIDIPRGSKRIKVTLDELNAYQEAGKLIGYDPAKKVAVVWK